MKWGRLLIGVAAGVAVGYLLNKKREKPFVNPEKVLEKVKNRYKDKMSVIGSWIHVEPQVEELNGLQYHVYQGGLTCVMDGTPTTIDFVVDADTGSILKIEE